MVISKRIADIISSLKNLDGIDAHIVSPSVLLETDVARRIPHFAAWVSKINHSTSNVNNSKWQDFAAKRYKINMNVTPEEYEAIQQMRIERIIDRDN